MEKALVFYRDILGMEVTKDFMQDTSTGGLTHTNNYFKPRRNCCLIPVALPTSSVP